MELLNSSKITQTVLCVILCINAGCGCFSSGKYHTKYKATNSVYIGRNIVYSTIDSNISRHLTALKVESIFRGYDTGQYRLWMERYDTIQLLVIKSSLRSSSCELYKYDFSYSGDSVFYKLFSYQKGLVPKSGWKVFLQKIDDLQVKDLKGIGEIEKENYLLWEYATNYILEYANNDLHRSYLFKLPYYYKDKHWQARQFSLFLDLLEDELRIHTEEREKNLSKPDLKINPGDINLRIEDSIEK